LGVFDIVTSRLGQALRNGKKVLTTVRKGDLYRRNREEKGEKRRQKKRGA